ncbi:MAG: zinc-ribbon domain-containing protein [Proteobacteria bacterium]|nr:zinc-ribbon domain-containing protein [Pseudomonadota bacterium]
MLVKCDKCGQSYEVNDSRLSPQGARIKCPACAHIFLVRLDGTGSMKAPTPPPETEAPSASAVVSETLSDSGNEVTWKVRHMGLTYTFHDLTSLQDWLSARPTVEDVKVAKDDDDWKELGDYSEVLTTELITKFFPLGDVPTSDKPMELASIGTVNGQASPVRTQSNMNVSNLPLMSGSAFSPVTVSSDLSTPENAPSSKKMKQDARRRAEQEKQTRQKWTKIIIALVIGVALLIAGIRIFAYGGLDAIPFLSDKTGAPETAAPVEPKEPIETEINRINRTDPEVIAAKIEDSNADTSNLPKELSAEEMEKLAEEDMKKQYAEAEQMVKNRQWPEARATLETLSKDHPNDIPTLQLLVKTYRGLNLHAQAAEVEARIKRIKSAPKNTIDFDE